MIYLESSHLRSGIDPTITDEILQESSYNLSGNAMTWAGRYYLLKNELTRNPVKRVYLEVSYNTLSQSPSLEGHLHTLPRFHGFITRFQYFINTITRHNIDGYLGNLLKDATVALCGYIDSTSGISCEEYRLHMGYIPVMGKDLSLKGNDILNLYNTEKINTSFKNFNVGYFNKIVSPCNEKIR